MRQLPLDIGIIHFVGIGGIGMSGIAEVMHNLGYKVQGSDLSANANVKRLRGLGIRVFEGHAGSNVNEAEVLVVSTAVKADNPEVKAARERLIPVVRRAEMLGELMRLKWAIAIAGTHGKTTTTSMVAALLEGAGLDPTVINGGIINAYGTNAHLGSGEWMVVEADESDGTFLKLPATIAIVTNIDPEHLDHYGTFDKVREGFKQFVENLPFYGCAVMCTDHPEVQALVGRISDRRIVTYGFNPQADVRAANLRLDTSGATFDVVFSDRIGESRTAKDIHLPMVGRHNVQNSLAALAVAREMGMADDVMRRALAAFGGVKRRFTRTGEAGGITVIDDYGHHPVEIKAVLGAARQACKAKVVAVVQPHRFTRLRDLFEEFCTCFNDADTVIVADVYSAGESPIDGVNRDALVEGIRSRGHRRVVALQKPEELAPLIMAEAASGDLVVCLGAGTITNWANALPGELARLLPESKQGGGPMMAAERRDTMKAGLIGRLPPVRGRLAENAPLAPVTWFRVGGAAEVLFRPADTDDLAQFIRTRPIDVPVTVLGVGSNTLVRDGGIEGVVVRLGGAFAQTKAESNMVEAGAGALDLNVALTALEAGLTGLEFLRGIPGTIGGALRMNAGAYGREIVDVLVEAEAIDLAGNVHRLTPDRLGLTYRHCALPEGWIFTRAWLKGEPGDRSAIKARMDEIQSAREASQPIRTRTGGSTFANPPGQKAWQLIDLAGCRGLRVGGAMVSEQHCNFLINTGTATAADIEALGETVRRRVKENSGIDLRWEIRRIGQSGQEGEGR